MYKNWAAICTEEDQELKYFVALAPLENTRLIEGLAKGFPELFTEEKQGFPVPLSVLVGLSQEYGWGANVNGEGTFRVGVERFNIPVLHTLGYFNEDVDDEHFFEDYGRLEQCEEKGIINFIGYHEKKDLDQLGLGGILERSKKRFIIVCSVDGKVWQLSPAECIDINS